MRFWISNYCAEGFVDKYRWHTITLLRDFQSGRIDTDETDLLPRLLAQR